MKDRIIFGCLEEVIFPDWDLHTVAKVDTGAYVGAVHATDIRIEKVQEKPVLIFRPLSQNASEVTIEDFAVRQIKNTSGIFEKRFVIPVKIIISGHEYKTYISLSDRKNMTFPMILGRQLLRDHTILVDVMLNVHLRKQAKNS